MDDDEGACAAVESLNRKVKPTRFTDEDKLCGMT